MPDILHRIGTSASLEKVYAALTTTEGLTRWWAPTSGDAGKGGRIDFQFCQMEVVAAEPGRLVHWRCVSGPPEWLGTEVTFRLRRDSETFVVFGHTGWREPGEFMQHCSTKWATFLVSLKDHVERGAGRPHPNDLRITVAEEMRA